MDLSKSQGVGVYCVNLWLVWVDNRTSNRLLARYALSPIYFRFEAGRKFAPVQAGGNRWQKFDHDRARAFHESAPRQKTPLFRAVGTTGTLHCV